MIRTITTPTRTQIDVVKPSIFNINGATQLQDMDEDGRLISIPGTRLYMLDAEESKGAKERLQKLVARQDAKGLGGTISFNITPAVEILVKRTPLSTAQKLVLGYNTYEPSFIEEYQTVVLASVMVTGEVSLGGWELVATVEDLNKKALVSAHPGASAAAKAKVEAGALVPFRSSTAYRCDHCQRNTYRKMAVVLWNAERDEWTQVGTKCLRDFLGHDAEKLLALCALWGKIEDVVGGEDDEYWGDGFYSRDHGTSATTVLSFAVAVVARDGFIPRSRSSDLEPATSSIVQNWVSLERFARSEGDIKALNEFRTRYATEGNVKAAKRLWTQAHEWLAERIERDGVDNARPLNDYEYGCVAVWDNGEGLLTKPKHFGLLVSVVGVADNWAQKQKQIDAEKKAAREKLGESEWQGAIGQRIRDIEGEVVFTRRFEGAYGVTTIVKIVDTNGNLWQWFASSGKLRDAKTRDEIDLGAKVVFTATVKKHENDKYNGDAKVTIVTRAVLNLLQENVA